MTDKTEAQPEALRLAAWLNEGAWHQMRLGDVLAAGRELRRQHSEIQQLKAQLSARQAAQDGWRLVPVEPTEEMLDAAHEGDREYTLRVFGDVMTVMQGPHDHYVAMLSAAPPPPEREPLTDEQIFQLFIEMYGQDPVDITEFAEVCGRVEKHHGIGATND